MSFRRRSRLSRDSHRSPSGATTATTTPSRAAFAGDQGWMAPTATVETRIEASAPPASPSHVLLGLTFGASWWLPDPATDHQGADVVGHRGDDGAEEEGDAVPIGKERRATAAGRRTSRAAPTQPTTNRVEAVPATAEPRSTPNRYQSRVKTMISTMTRGRAATPLL